MPPFFQQVFNLLITSPGNLAYHIIIAFSVVGALQIVLTHWRNSGFPQGRRTSIGLALLLLAQITLFASSALAWQNTLDPHLFIPPLERAVNLFSLVIILWIWAFPESSRLADAATLLLALLVGAGLVLSITWWGSNGNGVDFNNSWPDNIGGALGMVISLGGILLVMIRHPNGWGYGMGMLTLLGTGYFIHWLSPGSGDYSGIFRLAQLTAFPLLLTLPQRFPFSDRYTQTGSKLSTTANEPLIRARPRYSTDPKNFQAVLDLTAETDYNKACREITRLVSQTMLADICILISLNPDGPLVIACGYDLIREIPIESKSLDARLTPLITSALQRSRTLRLPGSSTSPDIQSLSQVLNVARIGHLLAVPLQQTIEADEIAALLVLSPYSNRSWTQEDQSNLDSFAVSIGKILKRTHQVHSLSQDLNQAQQSLQSVQMRNEQINQDNEKLRTELAHSQEQSAYASARAESLAAMLANQEAILASENANPRLAQLEAENNQLKDALAAASSPGANGKSASKSLEGSQTASPQNTKILSSIIQELRQPISSLVGYTDLLLGESIGILGATQRKFLERIKSSVERVSGLVEDLAGITAQDQLALTPASVNLNQVIDETIAECSSYLRDKNIALRVDLPDQLPEMRADHDALHQILFHLLQNAGVATPNGGEISLSVRIETQEHEPGYTLIQIADSGEGIPAADLPRVFSRLYRSENPGIQGVGDSGVGLTIVKTLVEAHGGRIWVDSDPGKGATYSVLLPLGNEEDTGGSQ